MAIDNNIQKTVINGKTSYSQKPKITAPTQSISNQRMAGGQAPVVTPTGNSGQDNQGVSVGSWVRPGTTPADPSTYTPQQSLVSTDSLKKQGLVSNVLQPAIGAAKIYGQGASEFGSDAMNKGISTGNILFGEGTFKEPSSSPTALASNVQPSSTTPNQKTISPDIRTGGSGDNGVFRVGSVDDKGAPTSPGSGSISFSDKRVLTPEQQSSLGKIIARNADPAFQDRLAEQNNIVNQRIATRESGDAADARAESEAKFESDLGKITGPYERAHIRATRLGQQEDTGQAKIGAQTAYQKQLYDQSMKNQERGDKATLASQEQRQKRVEGWSKAMEENTKNMGTSAQRYNLTKLQFGTVQEGHMPAILGEEYKDYAKMNPSEQMQFRVDRNLQ